MYDIVRNIMATGAILLGVAAAGTAYSIYQGRQAAKAQERAAKVQRQQRQAELAKARRKQIAEARRRRAAVLNVAGQTGTAGSSGAAGATGNLQSQLGGNLGFMQQGERRASLVEMYGSQANAASTRAATGQQIAGLAMTASSMFQPSSPTNASGAAGPRKSIFTNVDTGNTMRDARTGFSGLGL